MGSEMCIRDRLEAELGALAFGEVYTFGPTFRAENSNTSRHLAEFWMIEPEVAFSDLIDNMNLAEEFLKFCIKYVMANYPEDLEFLSIRLKEEERTLPQNQRSTMSLIERLQFVVCLLYTSPSPRDGLLSRMPSSA